MQYMQDFTKAKQYDALAQSMMNKQYGTSSYDGLNALLSAFVGAQAMKKSDQTWKQAYENKFAYDNQQTELKNQRELERMQNVFDMQNAQSEKRFKAEQQAKRDKFDYEHSKNLELANINNENLVTRQQAKWERDDQQSEVEHNRKIEIIKQQQANKKSPIQQKELAEAKQKAIAAQQTLSKLTEGEKLLADNSSLLGGTGRIDGLIQTAINASFTNNLDALVEDLASSELKARYGGNPTDGERQSLKDTYFNKYNTEEANQNIINRKKRELQEIIDSYQKLSGQPLSNGLSDRAQKWVKKANEQ